MSPRRTIPLLVAGLAAAVVALGAPATAAPVTRDATVTTITYDAARAGDFAPNVTQAAQIWNGDVHNVRLVAATNGSADVTIQEIHGGGSYADVDHLGAGRIYLDWNQAGGGDGYDPTRIAAHELGHIYGLPDNYNGDCKILMSGHSAGTGCRTEHPSAGEAQQVDRNFANGGFVGPRAFRDR